MLPKSPAAEGRGEAAAPLILALETSCDETAVAVLQGRNCFLASEIASQIELHKPYGGVVPELASRNHLLKLQPLIECALRNAGVDIAQIDAFAATAGPGLASSLLVGVAAAKGLALGRRKPYIGVNHLEGHLLSPFFSSADGIRPCIALVVSGGHTLLVQVDGFRKYRLLGQTRDDAAGEAFDKVARLLGLPYPGGPEIDRLARDGDPAKFSFPRSMMDGGYEFSFSGLKTAVRYLLPKLEAPHLPDVCASFQEAVVEVLVSKTLSAARDRGLRRVAISGGVSCNHRLREKFTGACQAAGMELLLSEPRFSTDNAAMIAYVAMEEHLAGGSTPLTQDIDPNLKLLYTA